MVLIAALAMGWAGIVAAGFVLTIERARVRRRVRAVLADPVPARRPRLLRLVDRGAVAVVVRVVHGLRSRREARRADDALARDLPAVVDLLAVAVASGCTPFLALEHAVRWSPPTVSALLGGASASTRLGVSLSDALASLAAGRPRMRALCDVLEASHSLGAPAAPALARLATELRTDLRRRAEARARSLSIRLIFPLVFLVLPAFALLTVAPAVINGFRAVGR